MDIFVFTNPTSPSKMEYGRIVNGLKSKMWVERYDTAGEFTFTADASSGARDLLPIGSFISHVDTKEIMVVENHEIDENVRDSDGLLTITGRGFETISENRLVGWSGGFPEEVSSGGDTYTMVSNYSWNQLIDLIKAHMITGFTTEADNAIPYISVLTDITGTAGTATERKASRGTLYSRILELLKVDNLGIKVIRPNPDSPLGASSPNVALVIHRGVDRSDEIMFSRDMGDIESAGYLWSIKKLKNAALLTGKWIQTVYHGTETGIDRRMMEIDASSVDGADASVPTGARLTAVVAAMQQLAIDTLAKQKVLEITKAEVAKNVQKSIYRRDFDVGDIVTVQGGYSSSTTMRISEYVEIEDENGAKSYPTLEVVE